MKIIIVYRLHSIICERVSSQGCGIVARLGTVERIYSIENSQYSYRSKYSGYRENMDCPLVELHAIKAARTPEQIPYPSKGFVHSYIDSFKLRFQLVGIYPLVNIFFPFLFF